MPLIAGVLRVDVLLLLPRQQSDRVGQLVCELHHLLRAEASVPPSSKGVLPTRPPATVTILQQPVTDVSSAGHRGPQRRRTPSSTGRVVRTARRSTVNAV